MELGLGTMTDTHAPGLPSARDKKPRARQPEAAQQARMHAVFRCTPMR
jgi:hypothetical protein